MRSSEENDFQLALIQYDQGTKRILRRNDVIHIIYALQERSRLWTPSSPSMPGSEPAIEKVISNLSETIASSQGASYFLRLPAELYHFIFDVLSSKDRRDHILHEYTGIHNPEFLFP